MINIYGIFCKTTWKVYYGSTKQNINRRLSEHKRAYKSYLNVKRKYGTSFEVIQNNNYEIRLLETCDDENKSNRESFYIRNFDCVNKFIPDRKRDEYRKTYKPRRQLISKIYLEKNKNIISEKNKEYEKKNKVKRQQQKIIYYQNNKDKLKEKYTCICGSTLRLDTKARHNKTKEHQEYIKNINISH